MFIFYNKEMNVLSGISIEESFNKEELINNNYYFFNEKYIKGFNIFNPKFENLNPGLITSKLKIQEIKSFIEQETNMKAEFNDLSNIKIVKILDCQQHPKSDQLKVCKVFDGEENYQIVTNAKNARNNLITVVAVADTYIPDGSIIKKTKMLNVDSQGMFLSTKTLKLDFDFEGIIELENTKLKNYYN